MTQMFYGKDLAKYKFEDTETFQNVANTWIRRKIAMINDSDVLVNERMALI